MTYVRPDRIFAFVKSMKPRKSSFCCYKYFSTNSVKWNNCCVVLLCDAKPDCSSSKIYSACLLACWESLVASSCLSDWSDWLFCSSAKLGVAFFRKRNNHRLCPVLGPFCPPLVQIFWHTTIDDTWSPWFRISAWVLSTPGDLPFFGNRIAFSTSYLSIVASRVSLFSIPSSFLKILASVFNL